VPLVSIWGEISSSYRTILYHEQVVAHHIAACEIYQLIQVEKGRVLPIAKTKNWLNVCIDYIIPPSVRVRTFLSHTLRDVDFLLQSLQLEPVDKGIDIIHHTLSSHNIFTHYFSISCHVFEPSHYGNWNRFCLVTHGNLICPVISNILSIPIPFVTTVFLPLFYKTTSICGPVRSDEMIQIVAWKCIRLAIQTLNRDIVLTKICNDLLPTAAALSKRSYQNHDGTNSNDSYWKRSSVRIYV